MLGQDGFGDDCPETTRFGEANNRCDEMDMSMNKSLVAAHSPFILLLLPSIPSSSLLGQRFTGFGVPCNRSAGSLLFPKLGRLHHRYERTA
jgi:hypothetical protein